jgi:sirohydrochlorin ferrochelatase
MPDQPPPADLLVVAHGTKSAAGSATTARLVAAIAAARPAVAVRLCFLDVARPTLADALATAGAPMVVVPLLLSTGYHVMVDIPAAVAAYPDVRVARHLGPHPLLVDVLVDRLAAAHTGDAAETTILVCAGSTRPEGAAELVATADLLAARVGHRVEVLTMGEDLPGALAGRLGRLDIAPYLLAEGQFLDTLRSAADGRATLAEPLGVHPALVALVWARYDEAR